MADIIEIKNSELSFEDFKNQNGITYWWASEFALMLGYPDLKSFKKAIDKATRAFISLNINTYENIIITDHIINGETIRDYKLTRFACYLIAMNADPKKQEVAKIQVYFAEQSRKFELYVESQSDIERVLIRDEIKDGHKSLTSTAKNAGLEDYAKFMNAGYLGMYNMYNYKLAKKRGVDKEKIFETMGRTELAANLFRITQTEEKIKSQHIKGQSALEQTHRDVGCEVRKIIIKNTGKAPEELKQEQNIPEVKKKLKSECKEMKKIDKK